MPPWFMPHRLRQLSAQMPPIVQRATASPWTPVAAAVTTVCLPIVYVAATNRRLDQARAGVAPVTTAS